VVNISQVTLEFKKRESGIFAMIRPQLDDHHLFGTLVFQNKLEDHNFDFNRVIGSHFVHCVDIWENLVVSQEFKTY